MAGTPAERPTFVTALGPIAPRGILPAAGSLLVADAPGAMIGAVGVTGYTSDSDETCALASIAASDLSSRG